MQLLNCLARGASDNVSSTAKSIKKISVIVFESKYLRMRKQAEYWMHLTCSNFWLNEFCCRLMSLEEIRIRQIHKHNPNQFWRHMFSLYRKIILWYNYGIVLTYSLDEKGKALHTPTTIYYMIRQTSKLQDNGPLLWKTSAMHHVTAQGDFEALNCSFLATWEKTVEK